MFTEVSTADLVVVWAAVTTVAFFLFKQLFTKMED